MYVGVQPSENEDAENVATLSLTDLETARQRHEPPDARPGE
jgi:hypothetical protein